MRAQTSGSSPDAPSDAEATGGGHFVMERLGPIRDAGRSFDIEYWQRLGDAAIFGAAWELVESYQRDLGKAPNELRLQRTLESLQRR